MAVRAALTLSTLSILLLFAPFGALAQDMEPRNYSNIPVGLNFLVTGYSYAEGGVATDPALPLDNAEIEVQGTFLAYARSLDLFGVSGKVDGVVPYSWLSGSADVMGQSVEREVSGLGDPRFRLSANLYGAPALSTEEYASYKPETIVGVSLQVGLPFGQYDSDKVVNIGTNRFTFKPEIGISRALGPFTVELAGAAAVYTDNDDFSGGKLREQQPIYSVQGHLLYDFGYGIWAGLNGTYYAGGRTRVEGIEGDDLQQNTRVGATLSLPIDRKNSVKLFCSTGTSTRTGSDFDLFGAAFQHRWGAGL